LQPEIAVSRPLRDTRLVDHRLLDLRSLLLHERVVADLRAHPERLEEAKALIARWRDTAGPRTLPALDEWAAILDAGLATTLAAALDPSDDGDRLRQSSPLPCLMERRERWAFLRQFRAVHGT
jgi:hypothetical protein